MVKRLLCSICEADLARFYDIEWVSGYHQPVCEECDSRAVNRDGQPPKYGSHPLDDEGDNPVFIDGILCWRRYRMGSHISMRDDDNCETWEQFYQQHLATGV